MEGDRRHGRGGQDGTCCRVGGNEGLGAWLPQGRAGQGLGGPADHHLQPESAEKPGSSSVGRQDMPRGAGLGSPSSQAAPGNPSLTRTPQASQQKDGKFVQMAAGCVDFPLISIRHLVLRPVFPKGYPPPSPRAGAVSEQLSASQGLDQAPQGWALGSWPRPGFLFPTPQQPELLLGTSPLQRCIPSHSLLEFKSGTRQTENGLV